MYKREIRGDARFQHFHIRSQTLLQLFEGGGFDGKQCMVAQWNSVMSVVIKWMTDKWSKHLGSNGGSVGETTKAAEFINIHHL